MNAIENKIGVVIGKSPLHKVAIQLNILTAVGTAIIRVAELK